MASTGHIVQILEGSVVILLRAESDDGDIIGDATVDLLPGETIGNLTYECEVRAHGLGEISLD